MGRAILIIGGAALLLGVWIYSILDAAQTDRLRVRTLPKGAWLAVLVLFPLLGSVLWFWLGRPRGSRHGSFGAPVAKPPVAPDDDPEFLKFLEARARRERQDAEWQQRKNRKDAGGQGPAPGKQAPGQGDGATGPTDDKDRPGSD
ncbi:MAG TPA: PLD nuclease N-terminal domain-containing protein [Candidatus Rothia avicola]|uniref:PLD nuclease N-terminal domain-containing protein n=1 Tax=Candidatus Rothia avicola TaxID=2840478 RepID=A0A9D2CQZ4_9MICC|nr:PLD nuclease N-terminal domain-containing protein [Candidatus Rothia avicola]